MNGLSLGVFFISGLAWFTFLTMFITGLTSEYLQSLGIWHDIMQVLFITFIAGTITTPAIQYIVETIEIRKMRKNK